MKKYFSIALVLALITNFLIAQTGNVGIGIDNPTTAKLVIATSAGAVGLDLASSDSYAEMRVLRNSLSTADKDMYFGFGGPANSSLRLFSDGIETMTIKNKFVGIGTTTPSAPMTVKNYNASAVEGFMHESSNGKVRLGTWVSNDEAFLQTTSANSLHFSTKDGLPHMSIDTLGKIGMGTTSPAEKLHVLGYILANGYKCKAGISGSASAHTFNFNWTTSGLQAWVDVTNLGTITTTSDRRLKDNIKPMTVNALSKVMQLKPVSFKYKNVEGTIFKGSPMVQEGFIADELQQIVPSAVNGEKDALTSDGKLQPQTLNLAPVVSILTKAMQEQQDQIEQLKAENKAMKAELTAVKDLKSRIDKLEAALSNLPEKSNGD
jgi:Chaperone of endosialidase